MGPFFQGRCGELPGRQADAVIDHLEPGIARHHRDLFGAVAVAVEAGLADEQPQRPPQPLARLSRQFAQPVQLAAPAAGNDTVDAGRGAVLAEDVSQRLRPFAGRDPGMGAADGRRHDVVVGRRGLLQQCQGFGHGRGIAGRPESVEPRDLLPLGLRIDGQDAAIAVPHERRRFGFLEAVHPDDLQVAAFDVLQSGGMALHQLALDVAAFDGTDHAAMVLHLHHLGLGTGNQRRHLGVDDGRTVEDVAVFKQIGLERHDLLNPQRPLLIPRPRQAQRLVPGRQLDSPRPRRGRQDDAQHLQHDPLHVVFRLAFGEAQGVDLHAVAEAPQLRVGHAVAVTGDAVPHRRERPHLAAFLDEPDAGIDEERQPSDHRGKLVIGDLSGRLHRIQNGHRGRQRVGDLLDRRGPRFLQMVAADVDRVPFRDVPDRIGDDVGGQPQRRLRRKDVGAARQILFDDVVLDRALQRADIGALAFRHSDVQGQQPRRRGIDRHGCVHPVKRDAGEQRCHVVDAADRHPHLADFTARQGMIGVVAGLGRQIEGHRQPRLPFGQIGPIQGIRRGGRAMPRIGTHQPSRSALGAARSGRTARRSQRTTAAVGR